MDPERWRKLHALFQRALELPRADRGALLATECADDPELRARLERMLERDDETSASPEDLLELLVTEGRDPFVGRTVGAYRLTARIARGGMGAVYRAERDDGLFDHAVAVKVIAGAVVSEAALRRFDVERRALAALNHPNIARLYDGGTTPEGSPYLVMELVDGRAIDRYCREERLDLRARLTLFLDVCAAVQFAHANLIVHQDLKPANVLVDRAGRPKLLDFGIARILHADGAGGIPVATATTRLVTPEYASPEQLTGVTLTTATDVYSLGVVLYELLTGQRPLRGPWRSPGELEQAIATQSPTRPSTSVLRAGAEPQEPFAASLGTTSQRLRRRLAGDLDRIVLRALRKEPERRYGSPLELAQDIERHLAGLPVLAREDSLAYRTGKLAQRHALALASVALVFLALVVGLVLALRSEVRAVREGVHARIEADSFDRIAEFLMESLLAAQADADDAVRARTIQRIALQAELARRQYTDPHLRANLLDALGDTCAALGAFDEGTALLQEAHDLRVSEFGEDSIEVALSLASLGRVAFRRGEFTEAERVLRRALHLQRTCPPGTHTDVALAANDLAAVLRNRGATDEAEALHREALALRRAGDPDGLPVAESLNNLAAIHMGRGDVAGARAALEESLAIRTAVAGPTHPLTLQSLSNLGGLLQKAGESDRARELLERAVEGHRALADEDVDGLSSALLNLAMIEIAAGHHDSAEERLDEAWELQYPRLGIHPRTVRILSIRAISRARRGDTAGAEAVWKDALAAARDADIPPETLASVLTAYGLFLCGAERNAEGEALLAEVVTVLSSAPTVDARSVARAHFDLASSCRERGALEEARTALARGLEQLESAPGVTADELETWRARLREVGADEENRGSPTRSGSSGKDAE